MRPLGTIVQIGQGAEAPLPMSVIVTKELELRGTFHFRGEFATAIGFIAAGLIDVKPLLTAIIDVAEARVAFDLAADKSRSMKVQLGSSERASDAERLCRSVRPKARVIAQAAASGL